MKSVCCTHEVMALSFVCRLVCQYSDVGATSPNQSSLGQVGAAAIHVLNRGSRPPLHAATVRMSHVLGLQALERRGVGEQRVQGKAQSLFVDESKSWD
jgi:hypothetical protein